MTKLEKLQELQMKKDLKKLEGYILSTEKTAKLYLDAKETSESSLRWGLMAALVMCVMGQFDVKVIIKFIAQQFGIFFTFKTFCRFIRGEYGSIF